MKIVLPVKNLSLNSPRIISRLHTSRQTEQRHTSAANQRFQPEHVMSTVIMYATRSPTCPHDNPSDRCHSVQVRSGPKANYNPTHEIVHLYTYAKLTLCGPLGLDDIKHRSSA